MEILFVINDSMGKMIEYQATGILNAPNRRAVSIELTDAQIRKLSLKKIGVSSGKDVYESIESVSVKI